MAAAGEDQRMTSQGVLFDFSGTLFRIESTEGWLASALDALGVRMAKEEFTGCARALEEAGALPGGHPPHEVPRELAGLWAERDRSADRHRAAFTALARQVPLPDARLYDVLYERHMRPDAWQPYPDAVRVLSTLHERGVAVAVVSNIGWDLRPVLRAHGAEEFVDACLLSFEHGVQKPDPWIFEKACAALGVRPQDTLMVGDDLQADGGATQIGCGFHLVEPLPAAERPEALLPLLEHFPGSGTGV
jgi:HAD superfamily hydrolase (TIGR01493 family)